MNEIKMNPDEVKVYSLYDIADMVGVSYRTIQNYIKNGKLKGVKIGRSWRVSEDNLRAFLNGDQK